MIVRVLVALAWLLATPALARPIVVDGGAIEGTTLPSGVKAWLGVPFAAPPVRELRWKPPQPVLPWRGTLHADRFAPQCLQPLRSPRQNHYFGVEASSEDCLYLNIWAPAGKQRKLPVIVWIYGGGFNIGSASMANYSGEPLAKAGVVRVNLAYRVGALGFFAHPELSREGGGASGNYGLMDQIAALHWIQRNIAQFGGDPGNVSIVGQSAGSMSVGLLQLSPQAKGLFHRVVGMSGSPFDGLVAPSPLARAEAQGLALQTELRAASLAELRAIPGDRITAATTLRDPIVHDGRVLTGTAAETFAAGRHSDVPLMIGYTRDETFQSLGPVNSAEELEQAVRARFPLLADAILAAYSGSDPARAAIDIARESTLGRTVGQWAAAQRRHGKAPVFAYLFARRQPYMPGVSFNDHDPESVGAYHSGDVPYWLRTRDSLNLFRQTRTWEPGDAELEAEMSAALLSFARTGIPAGPGLGAWPAFDPQRPRLVWLEPESRIIDWPHFADLTLFDTATSAAAQGSANPRD